MRNPIDGKKIKLEAATRGKSRARKTMPVRLVIIETDRVHGGPHEPDLTRWIIPGQHPEWRVAKFIADVPVDAASISYGLYLVGDGKAWLDSVSLQVVEK